MEGGFGDVYIVRVTSKKPAKSRGLPQRRMYSKTGTIHDELTLRVRFIVQIVFVIAWIDRFDKIILMAVSTFLLRW